MFSVVGCRNVFQVEFVVDYVIDSITKGLDESLIAFSQKRKIYNVFRRMSGLQDKNNAIRSVVLRNLDIRSIEDFVNKLFTTITTTTNQYSITQPEDPEGNSEIQPRIASSLGFYHSVKDKFYNEMLFNIKDVPSVDNYPKISIADERRRARS